MKEIDEWNHTVDEESSGQQRQSPVPGAHDRHTGAESVAEATGETDKLSESARLPATLQEHVRINQSGALS